MMELLINGFQVPLIVQHKQVKGFNIRVTWDGKVVVSVPAGVNDEVVNGLLVRKVKWIARKLEEMEARRKRFPSPYRFFDGETFWVLGKPVTLQVLNGRKEKVYLKGKKLVVRVDVGAGRVRQAIVDWMQEQALKVLSDKMSEFAQVLSVEPEGIELRDWKGKWGLCNTTKGVLGFNWRLVQLPSDLIDYIVVHELAHLKQPKHDRNFWASVGKVLPDWKARHERLKEWSGALLW